MQNFSQEGIDAFKAGNKSDATRLLSQAVKQNPEDESAWLYLGFALELPARKRQCFQRVLAINPENQQAKDALASLDVASPDSTSTAEPAAGTNAGAAGTGPATSAGTETGAGFANPIHVDGAPPTLSIGYIISTATLRVNQAIKIYSTRDMEAYYQMAQGATLWDSVFIAGLAGAAAAAAELIGRLIGFVLGGFAFGLGGLISPFFYAIGAFLGVAGGFAVGIWASNEYLKSQKVNSTIPQHAMYYALIFLPFALVSAVLSFALHALGIFGIVLICLFPLILPILIIISIYNWWLLKQAVQRAYTLGTATLGALSVNKAWIVAGIAVVSSYFVSSLVSTLVQGIFRGR